MEEWTKATGAALLLAGLTALSGPPVVAQEEAPEPENERCVCVTGPDWEQEVRVDADRIRRRVMRHLGNRARLGIVLVERADEEGPADGVPVQEVMEDGPADEAGLLDGDVIVAFDGHRLDEPLPDDEVEDDLDDERALPPQRLVSLLRDHEPGDDVEVTVRREGEERTLTATLDAMRPRWAMRMGRAPRMRSMGHPETPEPPRAFEFRQGRPDAPRARRRMRGMVAPGVEPFRWMKACGEVAGRGVLGARDCVAGLEVRTLNEGLADYFGTGEGVLVLDVADDSPLGLRAGDVVLAVDGREVADREDLSRILRSYEEGEEVALRIRRQDREMNVAGTVP